VIRPPDQRPRLVFSEPMLARLCGLGITNAHLSLTDEADFVMAFVVLESDERGGGTHSLN